MAAHAAGDTWEQWLPIRGSRTQAEVLVRVAHLAPWTGVQVRSGMHVALSVT